MSRGAVDPLIAGAVHRLGLALFTLAALPAAVMLAAVAVVALRGHALPTWLGWLSVVAAVAHALPVVGIPADDGPLVQGGWALAVAYGLYVLWLAATSGVVVVRATRLEASV